MVEPLIRQPMAMIALKGAVEAEDKEATAAGLGVEGWSDVVVESMRERRLVVEASIEGAELED
jgi:hypothetical protein